MHALLLTLIALPVVVSSAASVSETALFPDWAVQGIAGRRLPIAQGRASDSGQQTRAPTAVRIGPDDRGRYTITGCINGVAVRFLVDTGSALIRLNATEAARLGIDFRRAGTRMLVLTASGHAVAYRLRLGRVQVGGIQLRGVPAMVIDDTEPATALLGMSFLGHLRLRHEGRLLILAPIR